MKILSTLKTTSEAIMGKLDQFDLQSESENLQNPNFELHKSLENMSPEDLELMVEEMKILKEIEKMEAEKAMLEKVLLAKQSEVQSNGGRRGRMSESEVPECARSSEKNTVSSSDQDALEEELLADQYEMNAKLQEFKAMQDQKNKIEAQMKAQEVELREIEARENSLKDYLLKQEQVLKKKVLDKDELKSMIMEGANFCQGKPDYGKSAPVYAKNSKADDELKQIKAMEEEMAMLEVMIKEKEALEAVNIFFNQK
jgi:hypothetical protein